MKTTCQSRRIYRTMTSAQRDAAVFNAKFIACAECAGYHIVMKKAFPSPEVRRG
jgi:hypothetical protein